MVKNSVPCGADGFLGDTHEATPNLHTYLVEDEEEKLSLSSLRLSPLVSFDQTEVVQFAFISSYRQKTSQKVAQSDNFYYLCTHETQDKNIRRLF